MAIFDDAARKEYANWAENLKTPDAILIISAHWETEDIALGETKTHNELLYDYYGFPDELYQVQYPAPGAPELADQLCSLINDISLVENRGLDHGVFVPLFHMWPQANLPVLQMSLPRNYSSEDLFTLGKLLSPLRENNVLIAGAGTLTHNLRAWNPRHHGEPAPWAIAFDNWVEETLLNKDKNALLHWEKQAPLAKQNHPTPEHFRPLIIAAGAAFHEEVSFPMTGFDYGVFSKRSVQFG